MDMCVCVCVCLCVVTLVIHADVTGVEADVVLVLEALVLRHSEHRGVLHLQPELAVLVLQHRLVLSLGRVRVNQFPLAINKS